MLIIDDLRNLNIRLIYRKKMIRKVILIGNYVLYFQNFKKMSYYV